MIYAQVLNGIVNLVGGNKVGLPYNGDGVISIDITDIPENEQPKEGWFYADGVFSKTGETTLSVPTPLTVEEQIAQLKADNSQFKADNLILMDALATMYEEMLAKGTV